MISLPAWSLGLSEDERVIGVLSTMSGSRNSTLSFPGQGLFTNFASYACYKNLVESMVYIIGILHNVLQYKLLSSKYRLSHWKTFPFRLTQLYWMLTWRRMKLLRWFRSQLEAWDVSEDERLIGVLSTMSGSSKFHIELPRPKNAKNGTRDSCILNRLIIWSIYSTKYHTVCNTKSNNLHVTTLLRDASSWVTLANGNGSCTKNGLRFQQTPPFLRMHKDKVVSILPGSFSLRSQCKYLFCLLHAVRAKKWRKLWFCYPKKSVFVCFRIGTF